MSQQLKNKNIVIIGGTTGIGLSAAKAFIEQGAKVIVTGRNEENVGQARLNWEKMGKRLQRMRQMPGTAIHAIDSCIKGFGDFNGMYHVAGGSGRKMGDGPLHELSLDGWNKTLELNLTSLMLSNQAAIKKFLELKKRDILNMGSVLGFSPSPLYFSTHAYAAAKSAIIGFSKADCSVLCKRQYSCKCDCTGIGRNTHGPKSS